MKDMGFRRLICAGLLAAVLLCGGAQRAHAACTDPAGEAGAITYDPEFRLAQFCNDYTWLPLSRMNYVFGYWPHALYFDGIDDYYTQTGNPANVADSKSVTGSVWLRRSVTGTIDSIFAINNRFIVRIASDGDVEIVAENASNVVILNVTTTSTPLNDTNWHYLVFSIDMTNSANNMIAVDFAPQPLSYTVNTDENIDFTINDFSVGAVMAGLNKFDGYISDLWIETGLFLDFTQVENFFKFVDENGFPRFLGPDGSKAMGYAPDFFISGPYETQEVNRGTGGGLTVAALATKRTGTPMPMIGIASGCSNVGDTCTDGTIYVGMSADDKLHMYAAAADVAGTYTWGGGTNSGASPLAGTLGTCAEDDNSGAGAACFQGQKNSAALAAETDGDAPYLAAQACEELTDHGYSDWYLPSQAELITLQENQVAVGLANTDYWSSSEALVAGDAHYVTIPSGIFTDPIDSSKSVRCVRKQSCEGPYGRPGDIVYNDDSRVLQMCDGYIWMAMGDVDPPGAETGCASPAGTGGDVVFNSAVKVLQYCDGDAWHEVGFAVPQAPTSGMVAYWGLDETAGNITDPVNGLAGVPEGGGTINYAVEGVVGTAIDFTPTSAFDLGNPAPIRLTGAMTVSLWVNKDINKDSRPFTKRGASPQRGYNLQMLAPGGAEFTITPDGSTVISSGASPALNLNEWYMVTGVYEPSTRVAIYINGVLASELTTGIPATQYDSSFELAIGGMSNEYLPEAFDGKLDEVRVYNRALTPAEIYKLYLSANP